MSASYVHYDLEDVERSIRRLVADLGQQGKRAPGSDHELIDAQMRGVDVVIAFRRWVLSERMRGTAPETLARSVGAGLGSLFGDAVHFLLQFPDSERLADIMEMHFAGTIAGAHDRMVTGDVPVSGTRGGRA